MKDFNPYDENIQKTILWSFTVESVLYKETNRIFGEEDWEECKKWFPYFKCLILAFKESFYNEDLIRHKTNYRPLPSFKKDITLYRGLVLDKQLLDE